MIKPVSCITGRQGLAKDELSAYWRNVHGPIAARIPGLSRLVQSHTTRHAADTVEPAFAGVAELWFDSWDDLLAARSTPEWEASRRDQENFIDGTRTACFVTREHEIVSGS